MLREFGGRPVAGGTYPALIFKTFTKSAFEYMERAKGYTPQPLAFPQPSYPYATALSIVNRDGELMRDNGQCKDVHTIVFFSGFEPADGALQAERGRGAERGRRAPSRTRWPASRPAALRHRDVRRAPARSEGRAS